MLTRANVTRPLHLSTPRSEYIERCSEKHVGEMIEIGLEAWGTLLAILCIGLACDWLEKEAYEATGEEYYGVFNDPQACSSSMVSRARKGENGENIECGWCGGYDGCGGECGE